MDNYTLSKSGCWEWNGVLNQGGYGRIFINGKGQMAHRVSYQLVCGPIPDGMLVLHKCDNPCCIRPEHLFLGTHQDNSDDMIRKGRGRWATSEEMSARIKGRAASGDRHSSVTHPEAVPKGIGHGMHKLLDSEVIDIRMRWTAGEMQSVLADEYRVCKQTINNIVHRKNWKHLP